MLKKFKYRNREQRKAADSTPALVGITVSALLYIIFTSLSKTKIFSKFDFSLTEAEGVSLMSTFTRREKLSVSSKRKRSDDDYDNFYDYEDGAIDASREAEEAV